LRSLLIGVTVAVAALAATQPVFADTVVGQSGTVGAWSLTDTSANPGAIGKYRYYASDGFGWLTRFWVNPPHMKAVAGKSAQTVGWKFKVERKDCGFSGCNHWHATYSSPEQTAVTSDAHNASFSQATVGVTVPCGHNCEDLASSYRITVKMIWHRGDGSVQGNVRDLIYWYGAQMTNGQSGVQEKAAGAAWSPDF
jgi:hypothetical protein